jgi:ProP effector
VLHQKVTGSFQTAEPTTTNTIAVLAQLWPRTFMVYERRRHPLKLNIDHDIAVAAAGAITLDELKAALCFYCGNMGYLYACKEGADRIGLDGEPAGNVTASEAAHAARILDRRGSIGPSLLPLAIASIVAAAAQDRLFPSGASEKELRFQRR